MPIIEVDRRVLAAPGIKIEDERPWSECFRIVDLDALDKHFAENPSMGNRIDSEDVSAGFLVKVHSSGKLVNGKYTCAKYMLAAPVPGELHVKPFPVRPLLPGEVRAQGPFDSVAKVVTGSDETPETTSKLEKIAASVALIDKRLEIIEKWRASLSA